jgi:hypothetical protein
MNITKPKIFLYGGCDLHDIANNDFLQREFDVISYAVDIHTVDNTLLDFNRGSFPSKGTSIISLYTKPGLIAQRVVETLMSNQKRHTIINRQLYNEVCKFQYLDFYRKHAGPNDYLLVGFSPELYTKFRGTTDCFSCSPAMNGVSDPDNCFHWLYKEYLTKDEFLLPFDTKESLELSFDMMVDFARDIYEIFQDRVILVKTHFANFAIASNHNIAPVKFDPSDLLYYRQTKIITEPTDLNYAERLSTIIMNKFRHHYSSNLDLIKLNEAVFLDSNHRWGLGQFHIDANSKNKLAKIILDNITKKISTKTIIYE